MKSRLYLSLIHLLVFGICCISSFGETTNTPARIDPKADAVLRDLAAYVKKVNSISYEMQVLINVEMGERKSNIDLTYDIAMERPNKFAMKSKPGSGMAAMAATTIISDGTNLFTYIPAAKKYTKSAAPRDLEGISSRGGAGSMMGANAGFTDALFGNDPYQGIVQGVETGTYVGLENMNGKEAHHLRFTQPQFDWEIWVQAGKDPVVLKLVPDMTKIFARSDMPAQAKDMKMQTSMLFTNWQMDVAIPADRFQFTPPADAKLVENFLPGQPEPNPLLGKAAPDFKLDLLDGGKMSLSQHKDKEVVILDFWATWCGPCIKALPGMIEVAEAYKEKGVVFYAVNQQENTDTILKVIEKNKWNLTVPLDTDGAVGKLYHVRGIPQTVIIGKDDTVQVVHVGFAPDLKSKLSAELDALIAGKNLAAEAAAAKKEKKQ